MVTGNSGGVNTNKEVSCLKMEQVGIPRAIRLRFRRLPPRHRGIISAVPRRNRRRVAVSFNTLSFKKCLVMSRRIVDARRAQINCISNLPRLFHLTSSYLNFELDSPTSL